MNSALLNGVVNAVLYEGYILYPYRASSIKNQRERFTFGRVYPRWYSEEQGGAEPCVMQTECLVESDSLDAELDVTVSFLQPCWREVGMLEESGELWDGRGKPDCTLVPEMRVAEEVYQAWQEAVERQVKVKLAGGAGRERTAFRFGAEEKWEPIRDEQSRNVGVLLRSSEAIEGEVVVEVRPIQPGLRKITVRIANFSTQARDKGRQEDASAVLMSTFTSTHTILSASEGARFVSLMDPPEKWKEPARVCSNIGTWPVLVGDESKGERDTMLSSPIILYDYPQIAPESRGNLFDSTEIDEMLTLRIMTMTPEEKTEMRNVDAHARQLLERTDALSSAEMMKLHGARRQSQSFDEQIFGSNTRLESVPWKDRLLKSGDRVRIRPRARADVMDIALAGRTAVIEAVEQDAEQRIHLALVLDDDPGRELGLERHIGHRFFFGLEEVEEVG